MGFAVQETQIMDLQLFTGAGIFPSFVFPVCVCIYIYVCMNEHINTHTLSSADYL